MSHWSILGIARTTDEREIRKAYARVLKTIDQELQPEKFIVLREALESARQEAYYLSLEQESEQDDDDIFGERADIRPLEQPAISNTGSDSTAHAELQAQDTPQEPETPLHQHGFEFLLSAIQQQNSQLDLRKELVDYVDYISSLPASVLTEAEAKKYIQLLDSACIEAGLSGIHDFLNIRKQQQQANTDSLGNTAPDTGEHSLSFKAQEQHFKAKLDQLCQALWNEHFDDENFARFQQCLREWPAQSLEHQMATYDQLSYVLGSAQDQNDSSNRFLLSWYEHFGNDVPPASAEGALHRLHDRIEVLLVEYQFWSNVPARYYSALHELKQGTSFQPFSMLQLLRDSSSPLLQSLRQKHWILPDMQSAEHNPNLHYLRICAAWEKYWLPILLVCMSSIAASVSLDSMQVPLLIIGSIVLSITWLPLIQAPLQAWLYSRENHPQIFYRLTLGWYFGLAGVVLLSPLMSTSLLIVLLWLYGLLSAFIMAHGLYNANSLFDEFRQISHINIDGCLLYIGFAGLVAACVAGMGLFLEKTIAEPLSLMLAMPLIMALVIPAYISSSMMQIIRSRKGLGVYWLICATYALLYFNSFVFHWISWPFDTSGYINFWLASFTLSFIWLPMLLSSRKIAYILKYSMYLLIMFVALRLVFVSMIFAYLLYQTAKGDRDAWKAAKQ